jgi:hypothetical protein
MYHVQLGNHGAFLIQEEIQGQTSNTTGVVIGLPHQATRREDGGSAPLEKPCVLVLNAANQFQNGEQVQGLISEGTGTIQVLKECKAWASTYTDHRYTDDEDHQLSEDEQRDVDAYHITLNWHDLDDAYKEKIQITIGGQAPVIIEYEKYFWSRKLKTEIPSRFQARLQSAADAELTARNRNDPINITIRGRWTSDNSKDRWRVLRAFLEGLILDKERIYSEAQKHISSYTRTTFLRKDVPQELFPVWAEEFQRQHYPHQNGAFMLHAAGYSNLRLLGHFGAQWSEPRAIGAAFFDAFLDHPQRGAVFLGSLAAEGQGVKDQPVKLLTSVLSHEVAHCLFIPHAPPMGNVKVHMSDTSCVMNYEVNSHRFCGMCMLRMRGWNWETLAAQEFEYRIEPRLGDPNELFQPGGGPEDMAERLQVLGLFNRPLQHPDWFNCLQFSYEHAEGLFQALRGARQDERRTVLNEQFRHFVVQGGQLPAPDQVVKIRVPGGFPTMYSSAALEARFDPSEQGTEVARPYETYMLEGSDRFQVEQSYYDHNPALGKIPLEARVTMRPKGSGLEWVPAANVSVYFQLVDPDPIPPYAPPAGQYTVAGGTSFHDQVAPPPLEERPRDYFADKIAQYRPAQGSDPEKDNAHVDVGGIRARAESPFCQARSAGFAPIQREQAAKYKGAAKVVADEDGIAKVIFSPSRIGGDRYKIKATVGEDAAGTALEDDVSGQTGTMVRWRTLRVSRNVFMPSATTEENLPAEYKPEGQLYSERLRTHLGALGAINLGPPSTRTSPRRFTTWCRRSPASTGRRRQGSSLVVVNTLSASPKNLCHPAIPIMPTTRAFRSPWNRTTQNPRH